MTKITKDITDSLIAQLQQAIVPCAAGGDHFCESLAGMIGDARIVLMGEASHGTTEFYQARAKLSEYLIREKGFQAIAIEGDWTSAYPVHAYLQGDGAATHPERSLAAFKRFPQWMWCNEVMRDFLKKIRHYNDHSCVEAPKVGFYGLDLYCLNESMQAVITYLSQYDPEAAQKALQRYTCFDHSSVDPQRYGYLTERHLQKSCVSEVTEQLLEMHSVIYRQLQAQVDHNGDQAFFALQNARVVKNAEAYYRAMFEDHHITWNLRDQHMADTLQNVVTHVETTTGKPAKVIVWAHNSHVGDARATEMSDRQEVNLGQLVRERFGETSFSLGFSTAEGTVTAASDWGGAGVCKTVQSPLPGSYEALFHALPQKSFILPLREETHLTSLLKLPQLQRAIGVIYRPHTERVSHYYLARLAYQFDALVHIDHTHALEAL